MKAFRPAICIAVLATATGAACAQVPYDNDAPAGDAAQPAHVVTREQVRHERDLAVQYGVLYPGKPWEHWLDHDAQRNEQAFERALAREQGEQQR